MEHPAPLAPPQLPPPQLAPPQLTAPHPPAPPYAQQQPYAQQAPYGQQQPFGQQPAAGWGNTPPNGFGSHVPFQPVQPMATRPVQLQPAKAQGKSFQAMAWVLSMLTVVVLGGVGYAYWSYSQKSYNDVVAKPYVPPTFSQTPPPVPALITPDPNALPTVPVDVNQWDPTAPIADYNHMCLKPSKTGFVATSCNGMITVELFVTIPTKTTGNQILPADSEACVTAIGAALGRPYKQNPVVVPFVFPHETDHYSMRCGLQAVDGVLRPGSNAFHNEAFAALAP